MNKKKNILGGVIMEPEVYITKSNLAEAHRLRDNKKEIIKEEGSLEFYQAEIVKEIEAEIDSSEYDKETKELLLDTLQLLKMHKRIGVAQENNFFNSTIYLPDTEETVAKGCCIIHNDDGAFLYEKTGKLSPGKPKEISLQTLKQLVEESLKNEEINKKRDMIRKAKTITEENIAEANEIFSRLQKINEIIEEVNTSKDFTERQKELLIGTLRLLALNKDGIVILDGRGDNIRYVRLPDNFKELSKGNYFFIQGKGKETNPETERAIENLSGLNECIARAPEMVRPVATVEETAKQVKKEEKNKIPQDIVKKGLIRFHQRRLINSLINECMNSKDLEPNKQWKVRDALQNLNMRGTLDLVDNGLTQTVRLPNELGQMQSLILVTEQDDGERCEKPIELKDFVKILQELSASKEDKLSMEGTVKYALGGTFELPNDNDFGLQRLIKRFLERFK